MDAAQLTGTGTGQVDLRLPEALLALFPGAPRRLHLGAGSVRELIAELDRRWPGMSDRLTDSRPAIRKHINVFVDGERAGLDTPLDAGASVTILLAISGG
ncbi:MoaD/ThiS family protein [Oryzibacter oryziterrae]|uniref:MoaD/ThiS family protein n=1 Tax=Oryzibacter oryziterrae TaxID=2766474 RepID=UPI001F242F2A|nr:MoaD/ThiS family protein [Oryzibacter oryziterrae]